MGLGAGSGLKVKSKTGVQGKAAKNEGTARRWRVSRVER